jgi:hypothetical protein
MTTLSTSSRGLRKTLRFGFLALLLSVAPTVQANAAIVSITDQNPLDSNSISSSLYDDGTKTLTVNEDYNETHTIPYTSHDGRAVVNSANQFFDKVVNYTGAVSGDTSTLQFNVTNTTPWKWSDYHIELWNSDFTTRYTTISLSDYSTNQFGNKDYTNGVVSFWDNPPVSHDPLETGTYSISTDLYAINGTANGTLGIRQVATVPEPGTVMLLGIGALGMFGVKNAKRRGAEVA